MVRFTFISALFVASVLALPSPLTPDPAGEKNIGNGRGGQFIGGACLGSADCASTCCATLSGAGICSGLGAQFQAGKQGCGFGDGGAAKPPPPPPAQGAPATGNAGAGAPAGVDQNAPGAQNVGTGNGLQFITGQCFTDADCASKCCAGPKGACSAVAVANDNGKTGCGFGGAGAPAAPPATPLVVVAAPAAPEAPASGSPAIDLNAPGSQNVGKGNGLQFITGQCFTDADCASACCAGPKGACSAVAVANQNGKTGCGFGGNGATAPAAPPPAPEAAPVNTGSGAIDLNAPGSQNVGKGNGQQFITGQCFSNADCASTCCAGPKGTCAAVAVANENGRTGCGFTVTTR